MTTKPASGMQDPPDDGIEDAIEDALDEVIQETVEAREENPVKSKRNRYNAAAQATAATPSREPDAELASIPIPDIVSADSPADVPRGGVAGQPGAAATPIAEEEVVVDEDEVRVKVESMPALPADHPTDRESAQKSELSGDASPIADDALAALVLSAEPNPKDAVSEGDGDRYAGGQPPADELEITANDEKRRDEAARGALGAEAITREVNIPQDLRSHDVKTPVAAPPLVTDEVPDDETKVEPFVTAMRAAASMAHGEEREAGLATQAKEERNRALRQAGLPVPRTPSAVPAGRAPSTFNDAENDLRLDDDTETEAPGGLNALGRTNEGADEPKAPFSGYPSRRLPTPSPGIPQGPGISAYGTVPGLPRTTPSKPISSVKPPPVPSAIFNPVQLPLGGLVAVLGATFGFGLLLGAVLWRVEPGRVASQPEVEATSGANPPAAAAAPDPGIAPAAPTVTPAPQPAAIGAAAGTDPEVTPADQAPTPVGPPTTPAIVEPLPTAPSALAKPPVKPRPKKAAAASTKKTAWVDPFAQ